MITGKIFKQNVFSFEYTNIAADDITRRSVSSGRIF